MNFKFYEYFLFLSVRLLSVLRGHSGVFTPPQRPMTSDFEGFSIPDCIHYIYFPILILEKEPVFSFWMFSANQVNYCYQFYNVFGMTRSLTGDWTGTSRTRSQHSTTYRLSRTILLVCEICVWNHCLVIFKTHVSYIIEIRH